MASKPPSSTNPLPAGWKEAFDNKHGRWYFYNPSTKQSQWHHPGQLPEKKAVWVEKFDQRYNKPFWYNRKTKQSSWTKPADEPAFVPDSGEPVMKKTSAGTEVNEQPQHEVELTSVEQRNNEPVEQREVQGDEPAANDAATVDRSSAKASRSLISETASPQTSRFPRKSSGSTESIVSPVTARVKLDERRKLTLKALASSQSSTSDELLSIDSEGTRFTPTHSVSSPISMPPKSPHRKRGPDSTRIQMESTHLASSFNTDRDRAFKDGGLFGKQKLAAMQRSSAEDIKLSSRSNDGDRRHYSSKVPSNESLLEPTSPVEAPVVRVPVGAHTTEGSEAAGTTLGERRNSRAAARAGAFSSILNPTGNKKPPVILTSRPAFSSLHQRRMGGSKSPQNHFPTLSSGEEAAASDGKGATNTLDAQESQHTENLPEVVQTETRPEGVGESTETHSLVLSSTQSLATQTDLFTDFRRDLGQILNADVEPDSGESGFDESETGTQRDVEEFADGSDKLSSDAFGRGSGLSSIRSSLDESRLSQLPLGEEGEQEGGNLGLLQDEAHERFENVETPAILDNTELVESGSEGDEVNAEEGNSLEGSVASNGNENDVESERELDQTVLLSNHRAEPPTEQSDLFSDEGETRDENPSPFAVEGTVRLASGYDVDAGVREAEATDEDLGDQQPGAVGDELTPKERAFSDGEEMSGDSDWTNVHEPAPGSQSPFNIVSEQLLDPVEPSVDKSEAGETHQSETDNIQQEDSVDTEAEKDVEIVETEHPITTKVAEVMQEQSNQSSGNPFDYVEEEEDPTDETTDRNSPGEMIALPNAMEGNVPHSALPLASSEIVDPFETVDEEVKLAAERSYPGAADDEEQQDVADNGRRSSVYHILERQQSLKERLAALSKRSRPKLPSRESDSQRSLTRTSSAQALETTSSELLSSADEEAAQQPRKRVPSRTSSFLDMMANEHENAFEGMPADEEYAPRDVHEEQVGSKRPAPFAKSGSVMDMVAKLSAKAGSSGSLPIQFGLPPKQPSGILANDEQSLNEPQLREAPAPPSDPNDEGQMPALERRSSVKELVAKITKQSSSSALPIRFSSVPNVEFSEGLAGPGTGSQRFSLPELQSQSQSDLLNEAHMSRVRIPAGLRRDPSRRASNFAGPPPDG